MSENRQNLYEEYHVEAEDAVSRVREIVREGNVSRLIVKRDTGETILEVPLTAGVAAATVGLFMAPVLVAVGAVAALVSRVTIGVERPAVVEPVA